jgi:hypothetical protein
MNILLVKPAYKTFAPPLGLMKISTYHKQKGDNVEYVEGIVKTNKRYDKIYVTSLFSWNFYEVIECVNYYKYKTNNIVLGGHLTTFLLDFIQPRIRNLFSWMNVGYHIGLWEEIEGIQPDYSMFPELDHSIAIATRGCIRKCNFCGVSKLEPIYNNYIPIAPQIDNTKPHVELWGNNDFASNKFETIINELIDLGFYKGAKFGKKQRWVDFNQGTDCRLFNKDLAQLISKINIRPLRFAFDGMQEDRYYQEAIRLAKQYGIEHFSSYILYNFNDTPEDFYYRCRSIVELNEELGLRISGFPMKYVPCDSLDRNYIGDKWTKEKLRIIQVMKNPCLGKLPVKLETFNKLWGKNVSEFIGLIELTEQEFYRHLD